MDLSEQRVIAINSIKERLEILEKNEITNEEREILQISAFVEGYFAGKWLRK